MKKIILTLVAALALSAPSLVAQGRKSLRINEVMVQNTSSIVDDYGERHAWIELFNSNFAPLEISSIYLTTDSTNKTMYPVPLGDEATHIGRRQHVVFWADGMPKRGTFHSSLRLVPGQDNWIGIYDADGKTLIDAVVVPAAVGENQTYARTTDGDGKWAIRTGTEDSYTSPSSANRLREENENVKNFAEKDANGFAMTLMAMSIVFLALLVLCLCFYAIGEIGKYFSRLNKARSKGVKIQDVAHDDHDSGEEIAAIVMALHEHLNTHDNESNLLTIRKIKRAYSPWSSKIYSLRELPHR